MAGTALLRHAIMPGPISHYNHHSLAVAGPALELGAVFLSRVSRAGFSRASVIPSSTSFISGTSLGAFRNPPAKGIRMADAVGGGLVEGVRMMGGGPRTFPGGVSKWQWKRMQEKKQMQIEKARLVREKQMYDERRRAELMVASPLLEKPWERNGPNVNSIFPPSGTDPKVRALADRFRKHGAQDLWTDEDGPEGAARHASRPSARFLPKATIHSSAFSERGESHSSQGGQFAGRFEDWEHASNLENAGLSYRRWRAQRSLEEPDGQMRGPVKRRMAPQADRLESDSAPPGEGTVLVKRKKEKDFSESGEEGDALVPERRTPSHLSTTRFSEFDISPLSLKAIHEVMGFKTMTVVQDATLPTILQGKDVLAKAKTGTGKTIAFLLPAIETVLKSRASQKTVGRTPINAVIICPTRELANQAAAEAKMLMTFHLGLGVQVVIGGTNMETETKRLEKQPCQLLVGTPGRLLDHIQSNENVRKQLRNVKVLVLDEADQLLDMGFRKSLDGIIKVLPQMRQTLLFSATVPKEVHNMCQIALKKDHVFVDTVGQEDEETHAKVKQEYLIVPLEKQLGAIYSLLKEHGTEDPNFKVLVFCTTARVTAFMADFYKKLGLNTLEIHSRKSQAARTKVSDEFRKSKGGVIMFTSDVSARGVDYPDVSLVVQVGTPAGREQYIHRLGRTGRAGKEGQGLLLLMPWEVVFLRSLKDISIAEARPVQVSATIEEKLDKVLRGVSNDVKEKAYQAWLGYYNSCNSLGWDKPTLVKRANIFSSTLGLDEPPALLKRTIGMMGLRNVPGLRST